jgi:Reverse transcriptase (RNA-dependent DNA polymerase)
MHNWFINHGFTQNSADPCIYCRISDTGTIIVALYVDDCLMVGTVQFEMNGLENEFNNDFSIKRLGEPTYLLGMEIDINRTAGTLTIKHTKYITDILARFGMTDVKAVNTPAVEAHSNSVRTATTAADKAFMADKPYGAAVGCLQYLATASRPDIANAVRIQGKYVADPTEEDWKAVKRIMRYLQGTKQLGLVFHAKASVPRALRAYSDADWAGDTETRRSTTAYILTLSGCVISWQSRQQKSVALSTTEAEYMAACAASQEVVYMRRFLAGIGMPQTEPTIIFEDNQGCIGLANNPILHARTKHIDIRYHFINEQITAGAIVLKYISTEEQLADMLTKPLGPLKLRKLRDLIFVYMH